MKGKANVDDEDVDDGDGHEEAPVQEERVEASTHEGWSLDGL